MTAHTATTATEAARVSRPDQECWATASEFLVGLLGAEPDDLVWDPAHRLQGHGHVQGRELVVIAPRDDSHRTVVVTVEDWNAIRRSCSGRLRAELEACAITTRAQLAAALARVWPRQRLAFAA